MSFVNLHNHSYYSLLDGLPKPEDYILKAKEHGSPGVALTDHGVLYGAVEFYTAGKKHGINPIIGCETYLTPYSRTSKNPTLDSKRFHLILLAKNNQGYQNLIELITKAHLEGMYYKPRIDWELLKEYHHGLIALSGCLGGEISHTILSGKDEEETLQVIKQYQDVFGQENFFLEIQPHLSMADQNTVNQKLIALSRSRHIPIVATSDAHYVNPEDNVAHDIMLCIQTDAEVNEQNRLSMMDIDVSFKSPQIMQELFKDVPEAISNTLEIEKMCRVEIPLGGNLIPAFQVPEEQTPQTFLRGLCYQGLQQRYELSFTKEQLDILSQKPQEISEELALGKISQEELQGISQKSFSAAKKGLLEKISEPERRLIERLEYELLVINRMQFDTYFLIVQDFVNWAKKQGIAVGPGRGSAAGSLVSYTLRITDLDPLQYDLLFERFLNPARISMPDIDIDFADTRRDEVLEYVRNKYGRDHVAQICTFGTMAARQAVKDVGRALGVHFSEMTEVAKLIPDRPGTKLQDALDTELDLKKLYQQNPLYRKIFDIALKLEGVVRHISVHACAVVISNEPLTRYTVLQNPPNEKDIIITQLSAKPLDELGLLKIDFLGLRNLSVIQKALKIIKRTKDKSLDISKIPLDDAKAFAVFSRAETTGVFQFESAGMRRYLKDLKPTQFEDIIAMVALYRPGPMDLIPSFIKRKYGTEKITYLHQQLEPILKNTYGIGVYQEQMMQIARNLAGFTLAEGDMLRKAIGKKIKALLDEQQEKLVSGMIKNGIDPKTAAAIWELFPPFARYGFNKSHAACYALIAYQTAYLKAHFPTEFMAALLSSDVEDADRIALEVHECQQMGIDVLPPAVNESLANFTVTGNRTIRFGLQAIKGLGAGTIQSILEERDKNGKFKDISDFAKRIPLEALNKKSLEALVFGGAMDEFGSRNALSSLIPDLVEFAKHMQLSKQAGQGSLFGDSETSGLETLSLPVVQAENMQQKLRWEKAYLGLYISGHPLDGLKKYFGKKANLSEKLTEKEVGKQVIILGLITNMRRLLTKNKETMLYLQLEDPTGTMEAVVFPRVYKMLTTPLQEDMLISVTGRLDKRNGTFQVSCTEIKPMNLEILIQKAKEENFFDPNWKVLRHKEEVLWEEEPMGEIASHAHTVESLKAAETEALPELMEEQKTNDTPALFIEQQEYEDYTIELPFNCKKEHLVQLQSMLSSQPPGTHSVFFKIQGKKVKTNLKVYADDNLKAEVDKLMHT